jgi:acetoin utilization protein AcuB
MRKNVVTIEKDETLLEAKLKMGKYNVNQLPVMHRGALVGVISRRDIQVATTPLILLGEDQEARIKKLLETTKVEKLMTKNPIIANINDTLEDAVILMHDHNINSLPVLDDGKNLAGIITKTDVLEAFIEALGVDEISQRLEVVVDDRPGKLAEVVNIIKEFKVNLISVMTTPHPEKGKRIIYLRIATLNVLPIKEEMKKRGIEILEPWKLP